MVYAREWILDWPTDTQIVETVNKNKRVSCGIKVQEIKIRITQCYKRVGSDREKQWLALHNIVKAFLSRFGQLEPLWSWAGRRRKEPVEKSRRKEGKGAEGYEASVHHAEGKFYNHNKAAGVRPVQPHKRQAEKKREKIIKEEVVWARKWKKEEIRTLHSLRNNSMLHYYIIIEI